MSVSPHIVAATAATRATTRTCIATGQSRESAELLGWFLGADGALYPDWTGKGGKLSGRCAWTTPTAAAIERAVKRGAFRRALGGGLRELDPTELVSSAIEQGERFWRDRLGLANRAGRLGVGSVAARERARAPGRGLAFIAEDAGKDVHSRFGAEVGRRRWDVFQVASGAGLGAPTGREFVGVIFIEESRFSADLRRISRALESLGSAWVKETGAVWEQGES